MNQATLWYSQSFIYPIATLSGTIIGVGLFSLPYITSKVGFWIMLGYFLVLGSLVILIHQIFGELALKTPDLKRLPGFAKFHLGNLGEKIALISTILGILGTILAYLIVGGQFLTNLLLPIFGGNSLLYTLLYFLIGAIFIYFGIKPISKVEFSDLILFFIILILIFFWGRGLINIQNLFLIKHPFHGYPKLKIENFFLPYGPILFSLWGAALIPEIEEMLGPKKELLRKIIPLTILIVAIFYLLFIFLVTGICGNRTSPDAISGLENFLGKELAKFLFLFGTFVTFTSFIALGLTLEKVFWYDLKIEKNIAWAITCFPPLILFLVGVRQFIPVISFIGGVALGIEGILILLMYQKIKLKTQKSKFKSYLLVYPLILIFLGGIVYEIIYFIK